MLIFKSSAIISLIFIALFQVPIIIIDAKCNVCQANGAACLNSTSFYMCHGNSIPFYDKIYHCPKGFDCSNLNAICVQSLASRPASCGDTSLCGLCSAHKNHLFACTSRTTFRMCYGASQSKSVLGSCPDGYICNANSNSVCVPFQEASDVTCDLLNAIESIDNSKDTSTILNDPIDSSSKPSLLPSFLTAQEICDVEQKVGVFQIPGDMQCLELYTTLHKLYVNDPHFQRKIIYSDASHFHFGDNVNKQNNCILDPTCNCLVRFLAGGAIGPFYLTVTLEEYYTIEL